MVKTVGNFLKLGIVVLPATIVWATVTAGANAAIIKPENSNLKKVEALQTSDKPYSYNEDGKAFSYNYDYHISAVESLSLDSQKNVDSPSTNLIVTTCLSDDDDCNRYTVPEPSSIIATITAAGFFIIMKRRKMFSRSSNNY